LAGSNAATYFIWDAIRSIDYLLSRPEVDPTRIGVTGNSGGGTLSAYVGALDERVRVAVPSCYITSWKMLWDTIGPQDAEQNMVPFIANGLDFPDFAIAFAPKPYLINAAIQDFFPIRGTRATFREAQRIYRVMGAADQIKLFEADDGHGYTKPRRESAYSWFGKHFLSLPGPIEEQAMTPDLDHILQVTPSGQVVTTYADAESMSSLNASSARAIKPDFPELEGEAEWERFRGQLLQEVKALLNYREVDFPLNLQNRGKSRFQGHRLDFVTYDSEPGITLPALFFKPEGPTSGWKTPVLYAAHHSKAEDAGGDILALVRAGHPVLSPDLRGKGETARPDQDGGSFGTWFSTDYQIAMMALQLRRPLVGMRVLDLVKGIDALQALAGTSKGGCIAIGKGSGTIPLLHAAAADRRIQTLILEEGLSSWMNMVQNLFHRRQMDNVVQKALQVYDLPELAAVVAPRNLVMGNMVNALGHRMKKGQVVQEYSAARSCYELLGAPGKLGFVERQEGVGIVEAYGEYWPDE
jgi:cephalosporin-C deacetylase-like acetyl esterase